MADTKFKAGQPRPANAGRKKGTPNKRTVEFLELLEKHDFAPGEEMIYCYREMIKLFNYRKVRGNIAGAVDTLKKAEEILNDICQYVYPRKKAVEHSGEVGVKTFADFIASGSEEGDENQSQEFK